MSIKTNLLLALMLGLVSTPSFAQNRSGYQPPQKNLAELEKNKRILQGMAVHMYRKERSDWRDISSAPSFPLPLFRGNQTIFFKPGSAAAAILDSSHAHSITMQTRDPSSAVYQFYKSALPSSGFLIDNKYPSQVGKARILLLKGDSPKACASVTIAPRDDAAGPAAQISITVIDKPPAPEKK